MCYIKIFRKSIVWIDLIKKQFQSCIWTYGIFVSEFFRYARVCSTYEQFLGQRKLLTNKWMKQDFSQFRLKASYCKFYSRYNNIVSKYSLPLGRKLTDDFYTYCYVVINYQIIYWFFCFPNYDREHTANVTGQQRTLISLWHSILSLNW